jgi:hypothetical protein
MIDIVSKVLSPSNVLTADFATFTDGDISQANISHTANIDAPPPD